MSTVRSPRHVLGRLQRPDGDGGAAMLTALMLVMVVMSLSILVLGTLVSQVRPVAIAQKTGRTIFAAEAGQQAALGEIRTNLQAADTNGDVYGDPSKLPCSLQGTVVDAPEELNYTVELQYFAEDPTGQSLQWRSTHHAQCGVLSPNRGVSSVPAYAIITSRGSAPDVPGTAASTGDRVVETQYAFQRTNKNVPGGLFNTFDGDFCLHVDSASPGGQVFYESMADCGDNDALELWVQDLDSQIKLASTVGNPDELCITAGTTSNAEVTVAKCSAEDRQLFSYQNYYRFGTKPGAGWPRGVCLWAGSKTAPQAGQLVRASQDACPPAPTSPPTYSTSEAYWSWAPTPEVGAGSASAEDSAQFINYQEFGRCFELDRGQYQKNWPVGIGPCKQKFSGDNVRNQQWFDDDPGDGARLGVPRTLRVTAFDDPNNRMCLKAPTAVNDDVLRIDYCHDVATQVTLFTVVGQTGDYASSYVITDYQGRCVGGGNKYLTDGAYLTQAVVEPCTGALDQKWNAPPNTVPAEQNNTRED